MSDQFLNSHNNVSLVVSVKCERVVICRHSLNGTLLELIMLWSNYTVAWPPYVQVYCVLWHFTTTKMCLDQVKLPFCTNLSNIFFQSGERYKYDWLMHSTKSWKISHNSSHRRVFSFTDIHAYVCLIERHVSDWRIPYLNSRHAKCVHYNAHMNLLLNSSEKMPCTASEVGRYSINMSAHLP